MKGENWRTIVVIANCIRGKGTEIEWLIMCTHPQQILITETKLGEEDEIVIAIKNRYNHDNIKCMII